MGKLKAKYDDEIRGLDTVVSRRGLGRLVGHTYEGGQISLRFKDGIDAHTMFISQNSLDRDSEAWRSLINTILDLLQDADSKRGEGI